MVYCTPQEMVEKILEALQWGKISSYELGSQLGSWKKKFSHLGPTLQTFILTHPSKFYMDTTVTPAVVYKAENKPLDAPAMPKYVPKIRGQTKAAPDPESGPLPTPEDAVAGLMAQVPPAPGSIAVSTLGGFLGAGGWNGQFGHFGDMRSFLCCNPSYFLVEERQGAGPRGMALLMVSRAPGAETCKDPIHFNRPRRPPPAITDNNDRNKRGRDDDRDDRDRKRDSRDDHKDRDRRRSRSRDRRDRKRESSRDRRRSRDRDRDKRREDRRRSRSR